MTWTIKPAAAAAKVAPAVLAGRLARDGLAERDRGAARQGKQRDADDEGQVELLVPEPAAGAECVRCWHPGRDDAAALFSGNPIVGSSGPILLG